RHDASRRRRAVEQPGAGRRAGDPFSPGHRGQPAAANTTDPLLYDLRAVHHVRVQPDPDPAARRLHRAVRRGVESVGADPRTVAPLRLRADPGPGFPARLFALRSDRADYPAVLLAAGCAVPRRLRDGLTA